jgi:transposase-like protein
MNYPRNLLEAGEYFSDKDRALQFFVDIRWPNGVACPRRGCGSAAVMYMPTYRVWYCNECKQKFTAKLGTVLEDSPLGFDKWAFAIWMLGGDRNGTSSYELGRKVGVTQKSAWFMFHRIRYAMSVGSYEKLAGPVEADETYVGGKATSTRLNPRTGKLMPTGPQSNKSIVAGLIERKGEVRAFVVPNVQKATLAPIISENVIPGATIYTDALGSYNDLSSEYRHFVINHALEYVRGHVHTNGIENFWAGLKRTIKGTYIFTSTQHLERYLDEQIFRHNNKEKRDAARTRMIIKQADGRRLTYRKLIQTMSDQQARKKAKLRAATLKRLAAKRRFHLSMGG